MLAPKYSISDFFSPALFIYIYAEIGAIFDQSDEEATVKGKETREEKKLQRRTLTPCDRSFTNGYWLPSECL